MKIIFAFVATLVLFSSAQAQSGGSHDAHHPGSAQGAAPGTELTAGEVRKVDKDAGKLTIKHGEIKNLEMPPMTMVFRVKDPALLDQVKTGDRVRFSAEKIDGAFTVTNIVAGQ
jgi:Cu(I)/Ag(I) efflux system periplasmic protein CusF